MKRSVFLAAASLLVAAPAFATEEEEIERFHIRGPEFFDMHADFPLAPGIRGGRLGVHVSPMTEELREAMGAPKTAGILVNKVVADSPAKKAGIQPGDVIVEVEGEEISKVADVWKALREKEGDAKVEVIRDKRRVHLTAKIEKPDRRVQMFPGNAEMQREMDELRARIKDLEKRLEKLEKR